MAISTIARGRGPREAKPTDVAPKRTAGAGRVNGSYSGVLAVGYQYASLIHYTTRNVAKVCAARVTSLVSRL